MKARLVALAVLIGAVACGSDRTGPTVSVELTMVRMVLATSGQSVGGFAADLETTGGTIDLSSVSSFTVDLDSVEIHTPGSGWMGVDLTGGGISLDLLALPSDGADPIVLGVVEGLEPGECSVRLFLSGASISFSADVEVGNAVFTADEDYGMDLRIPSGDQTGLKADGACTVPETDGVVALLFDEGATLGTITATGSRKILVSPVIHVRTDDGGGT